MKNINKAISMVEMKEVQMNNMFEAMEATRVGEVEYQLRLEDEIEEETLREIEEYTTYWEEGFDEEDGEEVCAWTAIERVVEELGSWEGLYSWFERTPYKLAA